MILKNLWRRRMRTFLTMLGIAIGVAAVVALSAFGEGFASGFEKMFSSSNADLIVAQKDAVLIILSSVDESIGDELKQIPGVDQVAGTVISFVQMEGAPYFAVLGEDPRSFAMVHYKIIDGGPLTGRGQILLGKLAAKNFKVGVGGRLIIAEVGYRVVGIYETGVNLEDGDAVMNLSDAQRIFDKNRQVSYFNLKVSDPRKIDDVKEEIESRWSDLAATRSGEPTRQTEALNMYRSFGWFLGIFAVLVGGLGMMNSTLMSVFERTREIGVLRAIGWRKRRVIGLILGESLALAIGGGVIGILLGIGLTLLVRLSPAVESLLGSVFTPAIFVQAFVIAILLGTVGGLYPAWRAAQLQPVEAMRYEGGSGGSLGRTTSWIAKLTTSGSLRNLWRRPTRTLVTLFGIGIGVGFLVALIAITEGFGVMFSKLGSGQMDLMAEQAKASDSSLSVIDERVAERIRMRPEIKSVSGLIMAVSSTPGLPYLLVWGLDPHEDYLKHFRIREGRNIERPREIVVGRLAANSLKKPIGDRINVAGSGFRIVGIYENGSAYEDAGGAISLKDAQEIFHKPHQVSFLAISVKELSNADAIAMQLETDYTDIIVSKPANLTQRMQDLATTYAILNALIVLIMVVGGVVMMNAMLMSVFERTQEIGVLRALGWKKWRVVRMVLVESLALSILSSIVGIIIGVGLGALFTLDPTMGSFLLPTYTPLVFIEVLGLALVLGAIGGIYPAWRAAGLRPIEALRYE
jgi:ABC-type antimicrobial peptide transport system permease subunit